MEPGRRAHDAAFYDGAPGGGRLTLVHGNCQAESLRVLLAGSSVFPYRTVRMPPVHELTADDVAPLFGLLARTRLPLSQPVRDGYRGLPVGTRELAAGLAPGARPAVAGDPVRGPAPVLGDRAASVGHGRRAARRPLPRPADPRDSRWDPAGRGPRSGRPPGVRRVVDRRAGAPRAKHL